ncbi:MAG: galactokinase [Vicinamibacterales bacterium]
MTDRVAADAPGRVNLIGEHTDYHEGFVLPTVIPQRTRVELRRRSDDLVRAESLTLGTGWVEYRLGEEEPGRGWLDYVQGVTKAVVRAGLRLKGFDLRVASTVPVGAGVSSSAALEVSLLRGLRLLFDLPLDDVGIARAGQAAETLFVGAPVGIMDQMASSLGRDGEALFLDTRSLATQRIPIRPDLALVVIDSGITHQHAGGAYVTRRRESFEAAARLGVTHLRDLTPDSLPRVEALPPLLARRARHVITENQRVLDAVAALQGGDARRLGALLTASHASMRDNYETSLPDIDALVEIALRQDGVFGARLTGGGFGGAVVAVARAAAAAAIGAEVCAAYARRTGRSGTVLVPASGSGDGHAF